MPKKAIFDQKNILVTGGAGFIGSHLCDELVKTSKVICLDNFSSGSEKNIDHLLAEDNFEFVKHDAVEPIDLESLPELEKFRIRFQGVQEVYHCACPTTPKQFEENKIDTLLANSYAVKNALDVAVKYTSKFMHFSSSVVYGPRREGAPKIGEKDIGAVDILSARSCYDEGKRFAETVVNTYKEYYKLDTKIIRPFRIYGPRMMSAAGHMIPDFINASLEGSDITIYGDEHFSSSFCYIGDLIDAVQKLMDSPFHGPYNIGSDVNVYLKDVALKIAQMLGSGSKIRFEKPLLFMTPLNLPDISQARIDLGWIPVVTLEAGLKRTIEDVRAMKNLKEFQKDF